MRPKELPPVEYLRQRLWYDGDAGRLRWKPWPDGPSWFDAKHAGKIAGALHHGGYRIVGLEGVHWPESRLVWAVVKGEDPDGDIDHINRLKTDNRIENLRVVSRSVNCQNWPKRSQNKSGVTGVHWHKRDQKWCAQIRIKGKCIHLGQFDDFDCAIAARRAAEIKYGFHENHGR